MSSLHAAMRRAEADADSPADERPVDAVPRTMRLGGMTIEVDEVGVGYARTEIPTLIRASAKTGRAFHIRNAKNPAAATALLVSPQVLENMVFRPVRRRTLGEVLEGLPFKRTGAARVRAGVADNAVRRLRIPAVDAPARKR
jgi:hypothetical protein